MVSGISGFKDTKTFRENIGGASSIPVVITSSGKTSYPQKPNFCSALQRYLYALKPFETMDSVSLLCIPFV